MLFNMGKGGQNSDKREIISPPRASDHDPFPAWARSVQECEKHYGVDKACGLSSWEVTRRREVFGYNELDKHEGPSLWDLILEQFKDTLARVILGAAIISFEPLVIFLILILNVIIGLWQGDNAEKALEALKENQSKHTTVVRDKQRVHKLPTRELVPGDIVELKVGDKVPADMRVLELMTSTLRVEQGSLTGESEAVNKTNKAVAEDADIQCKRCMVFSGTTVVNGSSICLVTQTGMGTEIGKIHGQTRIMAQNVEDTPLKKKLNEFGESLTKIIGVICALVWVINAKYFFYWESANGWPVSIKFSFEKCKYYSEIALALAVAAIPEGLPSVVTTCLALGTRKMAQKNALVRKLPSIETLGCTTIICSDKTGTLTTNQMAVSKLVAIGATPDMLRCFKVDGTTYNPSDGKIHDWPIGKVDANLQMIAKIGVLCNDASIVKSDHKYISTGLPTEAALKVLVEKMGLPEAHGDQTYLSFADMLQCFQPWKQIGRRIATLEFDCTRKSMGVIARSPSGKSVLLVKGAVENVLERSTFIQLRDGSTLKLDQKSRDLVMQALEEMSTSALRCLGFAYKNELPQFATYDGDEDHPAHKLLLEPSNYSSIETELIFSGMVGLRDPPRQEVQQAIKDCKEAGIRVMVISGDNKNTAEAICREIGVFEPQEDTSLKSLTGKEFMELDDHDQKTCLRQSGGLLFSRAEPRHKQEIVRLLKETGEVVAMTGDGVNDAPALKLADIGISMGISGTEVAKESSDMVLADDRFSTIVTAIAEGRSVYYNMKAFIRYMISSNIGEVASVFLTAALGIPEGLIPVQLLWVNLVTDGPPATALGYNPQERSIMKKSPRRSDDSLISPWALFRFLVIGLYVATATVGVYIIWYTHASFLGINLIWDGHTIVKYSQLANWDRCSSWANFTVSPFTAGTQVFSFDNDPCGYFKQGKLKATTLSLSVLVAIEMFNSLNALSEDTSLLVMPPWVNPWLILAILISFSLHFMILYVPLLASMFGVVPLSFREWILVLAIAFPVILIDETLKFVGKFWTKGFLASCTRQFLKPKLD